MIIGNNVKKEDFAMKIKDGFILREVAGSYIVISVGGDSVDFNGMITVNETGAFLWKKLAEDITEKELLGAMLDEYEVDEETAKADISEFLKLLDDGELLEK